eukprot:gene15247-18049_t
MFFPSPRLVKNGEMLLLCISRSTSTAQSSSTYYTGAIVEYSPVTNNYSDPFTPDNAVAYMLSNLDNYSQYCADAQEAGVQIIVFPEYGILGEGFNTRDQVLPFLETIPDPKQSSSPITPCTDSDFDDRVILQTVSCMAIKYNMIVVVDMGDLQPCSNSTAPGCPADGRFQYNTQVAFSAQGALLARYHKSHLFGENSYFDQASPVATTFVADFGAVQVTFGMMICFDIMFEQPQTDLLAMGVQHLVYSSEWDNGNYLYAREMQQTWSYVSKANLLAANIGLFLYTSGSGIYSGGNVLASVVNPTTNPESKLLIAQLPITPMASQSPAAQQQPIIGSLSDLMSLSSGQGLNDSTVVPFTPTPLQKATLTSSNNGLNCSVSYTMGDTNSNEMFALISNNNIFMDYFYIQACYVAICPGNTLDGCEMMSFTSNTTFTSMTITGNFSPEYHLNPTVATNPMGNFLGQYVNASNTFQAEINEPLIMLSLMGVKWE